MDSKTFAAILLVVICFVLGLRGSIALGCGIFISYLSGYSARNIPALGRWNYALLLIGVFFLTFGIHTLVLWLIESWFAYPLSAIISITLGVVIACHGYLDSSPT